MGNKGDRPEGRKPARHFLIGSTALALICLSLLLALLVLGHRSQDEKVELQSVAMAFGIMLLSITLMGIEILRRRRVEASLSRSRAMLREVLDSVPLAIHWKDAEGIYLGCNAVFSALAGIAPPEAVVGKTDFDFPWPRSRAEAFLAEDREILESGALRRYPAKALQRADGSRVFVDSIKAPLLDEEGRAYGVLGIFEDVTEQKRAKAALRETDLFNREIIESAHEGIVVYDHDLRYRVWNPYMEALSGVPAASLLGRSPEEAFPFLAGAGVLDRIFLALSGEVLPPLDFAFSNPPPGRSGWATDTSAPLRNSRGEIIGVIGIVQDITERKLNETRILSGLAEKETLLRELYHRTKNNMHVISSLLGLQRENFSDAKMRVVLDDMCNRIRSMAMVHEKLYQSKNLSSINIADYACDLVVALRNSFSVRSEVQVQLECDDIVVPIDIAVPCGLLLNELICNAFKHAFQGGRRGEMKLSIKRGEESTILLRVEDDGPGFPQGFDPLKDGRLGIQTICAIGELQLGGIVSFDSGKGLSCSVAFNSASV